MPTAGGEGYASSRPQVSNPRWVCTNCADDAQAKAVFGLARHAMQSEAREVYLAFDHSWLDRALLLSARVVVTLVPRAALSTHVYDVAAVKATFPRDSQPYSFTDHEIDPEREAFHVVVSLPPATAAAATETATAVGAAAASAAAVQYPPFDTEVRPVDVFLRNNPCFLPLHDPPVNVTRETRDYAEIYGGPLYRRSAVFVRLPALHFYATCRMYTFITRQQNPAVCPDPATQADKYFPWALGTIGWTNTVDFFLGVFRHGLYLNKIIIAPRAQASRPGAEFPFPDTARGLFGTTTTTTRLSLVWDTWADPSFCARDDYAYNPWACHFISLSTCHTMAARNLKSVEDKHRTAPDFRAIRPPSPYMHELTTMVFPNVTKYRDGTYDGGGLGGEYEYHRLLAFVQRPNVYLRARIRQSLQDLSLIRKGKGRGAATGGGGDVAPAPATTTAAAAAAAVVSPLASSRVGGVGGAAIGGPHVPLQGSCVGLHVRNGDSHDDRNNAGHNLSLAAHLTCLQRISQAQGTYAIYLATDNVTLFEEVAKWYPQYRWHYQRRPLKQYVRGVGEFGTRRNAKSVQEDLADVLTDMILMSRCNSLMRSYSALGDLFYAYMCNRDAEGRCPPERAVHGADCQKEIKDGVS